MTFPYKRATAYHVSVLGKSLTLSIGIISTNRGMLPRLYDTYIEQTSVTSSVIVYTDLNMLKLLNVTHKRVGNAFVSPVGNVHP